MTVRLKISMQSLSALPRLPKQTEWLDSGKSINSNNNAVVSADDESLNLIKQAQYTSLRDLITESPFRNRTDGSNKLKENEWCDISQIKFKNKLLKGAAKAYLQPMGKKPTKQDTFLAQCWKSFCDNNKLVIAGVKDYFERQVEACLKFFRTRAFMFFQNFKIHHSGVLSSKLARPSSRSI